MTLTHHLIEQTPIGRELDALVAEYVLGWRRLPRVGAWVEPHGGFTKHGVPAYSTDIASAWLVVEHLQSNKLYTAFQNVVYFDKGIDIDRVGWNAEAGGLKMGSPHAEATAPTAPEAICRAALLSVL